MRKILTLLLCLGLCGCATVPAFNTPTGKPEVVIANVSKKEVIDALTNMMLASGFTVKNITDYNAVFTKEANSFGAMLLFGSRFNTVPEGRVNYAIVDTTEGIRVVITLEMVTNPGSAFENRQDLNQSVDAKKLYDRLLQIKQELENKNKK